MGLGPAAAEEEESDVIVLKFLRKLNESLKMPGVRSTEATLLARALAIFAFGDYTLRALLKTPAFE